MSRTLPLTAGLVAWLATPGCAPGAPELPPAPSRIKLMDVPEAELEPAFVPPARPSDADLAFGEAFEDGLEGWHVVSTPQDPGIVTEGAIRAEVRMDGELRALHLDGTRGLVVRVVPVEANTCYTFHGLLRADELRPSSTPFHGATYWLAELDSSAPFEVLAEELESHVLKRHILATATGESDWVPRERLFRTRPDTKALLIGCALGTSEDVLGGSVEFADVTLHEASDVELWDLQARSAALPRSDMGTLDWGWRRVRADLRAESRPSIVLLPGETLRFRLRLPAGAPVLEAGVGVWRPALPSPGRLPYGVEVAIDGDPLHSLDTRTEESAADNRWEELSLDLVRWADRTVTLSFHATGATPVALGAPCVRDAAHEDTRANVLLISIDMLRADHVGAYGYERDTTPNLDRLARENVLFPSMHAQGAYTLPTTISMLSGQFPSVHGVYRGTQAVSPERTPLLAEILGREGYRTQGFTAGGFVSADFGLDGGFDGFTNVDPLRHADSSFFNLLRDRNPELTPELFAEHGPQRIAAWLEEHADEPFFLFLHTYTVHDYDAPEGWLPCEELGCTTTRTDYTPFLPHVRSDEVATEEERRHLRHRYDGALRYVDSLLGELFAKLDELGLADETIVVVTSDHGEEMFERGVVQHGKTLYEEMTRIPLIVRVPGVAPRVVTKPVMTIDIAPTVLRALGVPPDRRMQGQDVLAADLQTRVVLAEIDDNFACKFMIRDGQGYKLVHSPRGKSVAFPGEKEWELYATREDPRELEDLAGKLPERFETLREALESRLQLLRKRGEELGDVNAAEVDETTRAELEALGY